MTSERLQVPGCKRTFVRKLFGDNGQQVLHVEVEPGGEIPLHSHGCAASMFVLCGQARTLGHESRSVKPGDIVVKKPNEPHGFTDIRDSFSFISISADDGIVHTDNKWDITYQ